VTGTTATLAVAQPVAASDRALFLVAGSTNWLVAILFAIPASPLWSLLGMQPPERSLFLHIFCVLVALFGTSYIWIGLEPAGKEPLVLFSAAGKALVVAVVFGQYLAGGVSILFALLISGDLFFAALFLGYLRRRQVSAANRA